MSPKKRTQKQRTQPGSKNVTLLVSKSGDISKLRKTALKSIISKYRAGVYASMSIPASTLEKQLRLGPDVLWIDGTGEESASKRHISISPKSLTALSIAITQALDTGRFKFFVLDSISPLLLNNEPVTVERFIIYIINKLRHLGLPVVILVGDGESTLKVVRIIEASCDKIISR
jgi:hypothetical protein